MKVTERNQAGTPWSRTGPAGLEHGGPEPDKRSLYPLVPQNRDVNYIVLKCGRGLVLILLINAILMLTWMQMTS